jgi:hypothetical protein
LFGESKIKGREKKIVFLLELRKLSSKDFLLFEGVEF